MKHTILCLNMVLFAFSCHAKLWLPSILSENMVLQQESESTIWGWTTMSSEKIVVIGSWNTEPVEVEADQGVWSVELPTPEAGGPYQVTIIGHETIVLSNVMIGEVWLCSGQSNMEWTPLLGLENAEEEIKNANYEGIRFFTVPKHKSSSAQDDTPGQWVSCTPESMQHFSSVAYFFGRRIHSDLKVPIGLINSSWGGTPVETWIPKDVLQQKDELVEAATKLRRFSWWPEEPGVAYNAMIHPLKRFDIKGALWYQGESNRVNANSYYQSFPLLIESWRKVWKNEFPFYFVQIAPFKYDADNPIDAAIVRDAQLHTMKTVSNTGMVVTNDIGDIEDIHPRNKQDVGNRLALWALAKTYGVKNLEYCGPVFQKLEIKDSNAIVHFNHVDSGLKVKGDKLTEFYLAGEDREFHKAESKILGKTIKLSSDKVKKPKAVRFAFSNTAQPNLFNGAGLPATAFRTDTWE